jgi:5'-methylthioadenosine phosphorylase
MSKIGIIAGSGVDTLLFMEGFKSVKVKNEFGVVRLKTGRVEGKEIFFLNRHGVEYCAPHQINYRANLQALKQAGVAKIVAIVAVGSMNPAIKPGDFMLLSDFIDQTRDRIEYFDPMLFTDISSPYDLYLRSMVNKAAGKIKIKIHPSAVYVCTEGPRFESRAEIKMFRKMGGDVVGMTQVPEVVLAAELRIPYVVVGVATNFAAGVQPAKISSEEVVLMMKDRAKPLSQLMMQIIKLL